jgi:hypothetical protein
LLERWFLHCGNFVISLCPFGRMTLGKKRCWNIHHPHLVWSYFIFPKFLKIFLNNPSFESFEDIENNVKIALK